MNYKNYDQLPLTLNAKDVASILGISRANAYFLFHADGFPTVRIGKRMLVCKDKFLKWLDGQQKNVV